MKIRGALATPDGRVRVEVVQEGSRYGYRILADGEILHGRDFPIGIGEVQHYLQREGIDMADLVEVTDRAAGTSRKAGVA